MLLEPHRASSDVSTVAKFLMAAGGNRPLAAEMLEYSGLATPRLVRMTKAAVGAAHLTDTNFGEVLADWQIASGAFFASLRTQSIFFRGLDSGIRRVPMRTRIGVVSLGATAYSRGEGQAIPISKLTLDLPTLTPSTAAAIIVVTKEVAEHQSSDAANLINSELRAAVAEVVDTEFFSAVMPSGTPSTPSAGTDEAAMREDLRTLLEAVNVRGGQLLWAMAVDVGNRAALVDDARGAMSPVGGELLGLPAMVSSAIPSGTLRLLNLSGIAGNADPVALDATTQADLQMADDAALDAVTPTPAELTSLFQTNSVALRAQIKFAAERLRDDAVAEITDVQWGSLST